MFDKEELGRLPGATLLELAASNHRVVMEAENQALMIAAAWADDQDRDPSDDYAPLIHRATDLGGEGCPQVSEFAAAELGAVLGVGIASGRAMIADALDLRHRLPQIWRRVCAAEIRAWQARRVAAETRQLSWEQAADLDAALSGFLGAMPWPRFERLLYAAILQADPERLAERAEKARTERMVRAYNSDHGLKTLVARATSGDVTWFMATVNRIAEILHAEGDTDEVDVRRSKAIGILAQPAAALQLLMKHRSDRPADDLPPEPAPAEDEPMGEEPAEEPAEDPKEDWPAGEKAPTEFTTGPAAESEGPTLPPAGPASSPNHAGGEPAAAPVSSCDGAGTAHSSLLPAAAEDAARAIATIDPAALRPRVTLYFHLAEAALGAAGALVRPEHGDAISLDQLRDFLAETGCKVTVRPVITPADQAPVDGYEIPNRIREAVRLRNIVDVFPYGSCASVGMDLDHTRPYRFGDPPDRARGKEWPEGQRPDAIEMPEGDQTEPRGCEQKHAYVQARAEESVAVTGSPPAQTGLHNLGPLSRASHRAATPGKHAGGRWLKRQPDSGSFVWRSPHGWIYLVTADGTLRLGTGAFAKSVWRAADATGGTVRAA